MPALIALLLTAFVMRGPVTGVGPVAAEVVAAYGTTWSLYGLLAALPVAAFGLCSFLAPALQARLGLCGAASAALALLLLGTALRFIANLAAFAGGMFLLGAGIALLNVLMPVVIKTRWPRRIGMLMGLYTGMIGLSGAVGGLTAAPLFAWGGSLSWPFGFWTAGALLALMVWLLLMQCRTQGQSSESRCSAPKPAEDKERPLGLLRRTLRAPLAWILTGVMGLQSTLIYTAAAWMPSYWRSQGMSFETTGIWIFVFLFSGLPASVMTAKFFKVCPSRRARWRRMAPSCLCCRWSCTGGDALGGLPLDGFAYEGQSSHARRIDALSRHRVSGCRRRSFHLRAAFAGNGRLDGAVRFLHCCDYALGIMRSPRRYPSNSRLAVFKKQVKNLFSKEKYLSAIVIRFR